MKLSSVGLFVAMNGMMMESAVEDGEFRDANSLIILESIESGPTCARDNLLKVTRFHSFQKYTLFPSSYIHF